MTGAGGSIGVGRAVRSPPDGYTVSFGHLGTHVANGAIYKLGYDLVDDLAPVVLLPSNPMIVVSKNAVPAKTLKELLAWLKARPGPPTAGTAGAGSGSHIGLYFENITGISKLQMCLSRLFGSGVTYQYCKIGSGEQQKVMTGRHVKGNRWRRRWPWPCRRHHCPAASASSFAAGIWAGEGTCQRKYRTSMRS